MKKFLGTLKGKVAAILLVIVMFTGAGAAVFASTAGDQLRDWYDGMFNQTVDTIEADVTAEVDSVASELVAEYEGMKEEAAFDLDLTRETATGESLEEIVEAKLAHVEDIDEEKAEILATIGLEFYNVYMDGYLQMLNHAEEAEAYAANDLPEYLGEVSDEAIDEMTTDIHTARDEAVTELEDAIEAAQDELASELATQQEITTTNLMNQVDWIADDLRDSVTELLEGLVIDHQEIIVEAAADLEADAIEALDDVISNINE